MLTNVYYYNHYRPYIVKNDRAPKTSPRIPYSNTAPEVWDSKGKTYTLNKAFKRDTLTYARELSANITKLKDSALSITRDFDELPAALDEDEYENFREQVSDDLRFFTYHINKTRNFSLQQEHSETITDFGDRLTDVIIANTSILKTVGIEPDENGNLTFSKDKTKDINPESLNQLLSDISDVTDIIYSQTTELLSRPLSEYMNFKNLGFYYNYKYGKIGDDSSRLIESGMIIDRAI